jgi:hypothetical protein
MEGTVEDRDVPQLAAELRQLRAIVQRKRRRA